MLKTILQFLSDYFEGLLFEYEKRHADKLLGGKRNSGWSKLQKEVIKERGGKCEITGSTRNLNVHHLIPVHIRPDLEMVKSNLVVLTRWVHFYFAHLGSWFSWNENLLEDIIIWKNKIKNRPK